MHSLCSLPHTASVEREVAKSQHNRVKKPLLGGPRLNMKAANRGLNVNK